MLDKLALRLAFAVAGMNFILPKLADVLQGQSPRVVAVVLCLPAAVLGTIAWFSVRSFAKSWPVLLCLAVAWFGLYRVSGVNVNRSTVFITYLTIIVPIATLVVRHRCWWHCAKIYVIANALAMGLALWFEYSIEGSSMMSAFYRFGFLVSEDGTQRLSNPNIVGGQLAFAAVLAFMLFLRGGLCLNRNGQWKTSGPPFSLGWTLFLSLGVVITASRGAFLAWFAGIGTLLFFGLHAQGQRRQTDIIVAGGLMMSLALLMAIATGFSPWESLQTRFDLGGNVWQASGRLEIWKNAFRAWTSSWQYFTLGTGAGVAPETLAHFLRIALPDGVTPAALDTHNTFVEWGLSFGLLGIVVGICLVVAVVYKAVQLDHRDGFFNRRALLLCFFLTSMNYVSFYQLFFISAGALILAMLSEPAPIVRKTPVTTANLPVARQRQVVHRDAALPVAVGVEMAGSGGLS